MKFLDDAFRSILIVARNFVILMSLKTFDVQNPVKISF